MIPDIKMIAESLGKARQNSDGSFTCCCPAHDDSNPSLSINISDDGKTLIHCFAGCPQEAVISELKDLKLWPETSSSFSHIPKELQNKKWQQMSPIPAGVGDPPSEHYKFGLPTIVYVYRNIDGNILGYIYRFDLPDGSKEIRPLIYARLDDYEDWRWQGFDKPRPLYGLEQLQNRPAISFVEVTDAVKVLIVEGEKAADAARLLFPDMPVLTWSGGAKAVMQTDWSPLYFYDVTIWPDNDDPGKKAALTIARILDGHCDVSIVEPPERLSSGWDLADVGVSL